MPTPLDDRPYQQILEDYARLEPDGGDTWNPLHCDVELLHRTELLRQLVWALRAAEVKVESLRVLDVGCGNGRSTRMYLDLGLIPEQLLGIDLRPDAIARARALHPAIDHRSYDGAALPLPDASVSWVSLCTVLSSIRAPAERLQLGAEITRVLEPGGHLFYWDLRRANDFAGGDRLDAASLFPQLSIVQTRPARVDGFHAREAAAGGAAHPAETPSSAATHDGFLLRR